MFNNNQNQNWTTQKFINLSKALEQAYCLGTDNTKSSKKADSWTTDKFVEMSRYLASAYGVDF